MKRSKKKALANRKLTIIKVLPKDGTISQADLDHWHEVFRNNLTTPELAAATGEVEVEYIPVAKEGQQFITVVRVGDDEYSPTMEDLEHWRDIFKEAQDDPDFKIFTHNAVNIEVIDLGKIVAVE